MTTLKHKLKFLCANNDMTLLDLMRAYNKFQQGTNAGGHDARFHIFSRGMCYA